MRENPGVPRRARTRATAVPVVSSGSVSAGLDTALERVGDRWTLLLVAALMPGPMRFGELQAGVPGIATNVLTTRLRDLEHEGLVVARPYSERPLRLEYELTAPGAELAGVLRLLAAWGSEAGPAAPGREGDVSASAGAPVHSVCGTPLEVRYWCQTCQQVADDEGEEVWA